MMPGSVQAVMMRKTAIRMMLRKKIMGRAGVTVQTVGMMKMQKGINSPATHTPRQAMLEY